MPRSIAHHLDIEIDPNNPPPAASPLLTKTIELVEKSWNKFEDAEAMLPPLDDLVNAEALDYVSAHRRATKREIEEEKARIIDRLYPPRLQQAYESCREFELAIAALEEVANKEPETLQGRAAFELDLDVMKKCLATTREIIQVAQNQLNGVRARLNLPL
jgi:hypothetical protein